MDALKDEEILFVGTADAEHTEMYLKAIWHIREKGGEVKISTIAKRLNVRQPSVVQMLKKLSSIRKLYPLSVTLINLHSYPWDK